MSKNEETSEISIEKPLSLRNANFVSFQIKREDWNLYKLEDESLLKARLVLKSFLMEGKIDDMETQIKLGQKAKLGVNFSPQVIYAIEAPSKLRGTPDSKIYSAEEYKASITQGDMDFETIKETWNLYELENGIALRIRTSPAVVSKTSKFESGGMPVYLIAGNVEMKIDLPDHIQKMMEEAKKKQVPSESEVK
jgi:hypothetical protein